MIIIQSYIKAGEEFIPVANYNLSVSDPRYIDGAIELEIDYRPVLTKQLWDLVDQLWAYIVNGLAELLQGNSFETYFPDQPVLMSFDHVGANKVKVSVQGTTRATAVVPLYELLDALTGAGEFFFQRMTIINPANEAAYTDYLTEIKRIQTQMASL